jgi:hypothetical protein
MCKNSDNTHRNTGIPLLVSVTIFLIISFFTTRCYCQNINTAKWWNENFNNSVMSLSLPDFLYNSDNKIFYIIGNDKDSLFICLKIPDEFQQAKILHGGITLWIDLKDKKHKELGIRFPVGKMPPKHFKDNEQYLDVNERRNQLLERLNEIELIGFNGDKDRYIIPCDNPADIHASIDYDKNGYLFYKLVIPFNKLPASTWNSDKLFSIGFETAEQNFSGQKREGHEGEGMHPGGRGGRAGGMGGGYDDRAGGMDEGYGGRTGGHREMGGGQYSGDGDSDHSHGMQQSFAPINFWIKKIKLASR